MTASTGEDGGSDTLVRHVQRGGTRELYDSLDGLRRHSSTMRRVLGLDGDGWRRGMIRRRCVMVTSAQAPVRCQVEMGKRKGKRGRWAGPAKKGKGKWASRENAWWAEEGLGPFE
jgi:hypothetical protein